MNKFACLVELNLCCPNFNHLEMYINYLIGPTLFVILSHFQQKPATCTFAFEITKTYDLGNLKRFQNSLAILEKYFLLALDPHWQFHQLPVKRITMGTFYCLQINQWNHYTNRFGFKFKFGNLHSVKAYNNLAVIAGLLGWVSNPRTLDIWFHSYQLQHQEVSAMHCHIIQKLITYCLLAN